MDERSDRRSPSGRRTVCVMTILLGFTGCGSAGVPSATNTTTGTTAAATMAASTTSTATQTTINTVVPPSLTLRRIWFVKNERLMPTYRSTRSVEDAVRAVLSGPSSIESSDLTTAIPAGTSLHSVRVNGDVAMIDLGRDFAGGGGSANSILERVGQIVFTLTEIPGVSRVSFALDGIPVASIGGEGFDVSQPIGRDALNNVKPFILASQPRPGQVVTTPLRIVGENSTFENTVEIALRTADGRPLVETFATGSGPISDREGQPLWGPFESAIEFYSGSASSGILALTETAADGSGRLLADFQVPVTFVPSSPSPVPPLDGASLDAVMVPPGRCCDPGPTTFLTHVSTQQLNGFDRIVFDFSAPLRNYHVRYVPLPVKRDPSDLPVALQGDSALQISMGATGLDQNGSIVRQTYTGPSRIGLGSGSVIEVVETGDFEAVLNWAVGLRGKPTFRVSVGASRSSLVIDVAAGLRQTS